MRPFLGYSECLLSQVAVSVCVTYKMIQKENSIICEVIVSAIDIKKVYMNTCHSEWLLRQSHQALQTSFRQILFVGLDEERSLQH